MQGGVRRLIPAYDWKRNLPPLILTHGLFQRWRYIPWSGVNHDKNTFRIAYPFPEDQHTVLVAMKVPYTPRLSDALMHRLQKRWEKEKKDHRKGEPDWKVVKVGQSGEGRPLWLVRIGKAILPAKPQPDNTLSAEAPHRRRAQQKRAHVPTIKLNRPVILFYAREHADEHDGSWVAQGVIEFLMSDNPAAAAIRHRFTVLIIPMLDPDGAAANIYESHVIRSFDTGAQTRESLAWAGWLQSFVDRGNRMDLVVDLHNVESGEGEQLFPYMFEGPRESMRAKMSQALHNCVRQRLRKWGFEVATRSGGYGSFSTRLGGWLRRYFGAHLMFYEANSQARHRHLSLYEVKELGVGILEGSAIFLASPQSVPLRQGIELDRRARYARWDRYGWMEQLFPSNLSVFEQESKVNDMPNLETYFLKEHPIPAWLSPLYKRFGRRGPPPNIRERQFVP